MQMSKKERKKKLFSYYAANLSIYCPEYKDQFMCPLCQRVFSREDLLAHPPKISLAHAPPSAVDGTLTTLACTECDNKIGECDRQVKYEKDAAEDFENRIVKDAIFISANGTRLPCRLEIDDDKCDDINIYVVNKPGMPLEHYLKIAERIKGDYSSRASPYDFSIETEAPKRDLKKWLTSQIYASLLIMFYYFGYEYVLNPNIDDMRRSLKGDEILKYKNIIISIHEKTSPEQILRPAVSIWTIPKDLQCFLVEIPSPNKECVSRIIALPGFGESALKTYENLMGLPSDINSHFTSKPIKFDEIGKILPDPHSKGYGESLWKNVTDN